MTPTTRWATPAPADAVFIADGPAPPGFGDAIPAPARPLDALDGLLRDGHPPAEVVCLAIGAQFDCLDVAQVLAQRGFAGRLRIVAADLPRPAIIGDELRRLYPALDIGVVTQSDALQPAV